MKRRVVVTGLGAVTSLSLKVEDLWQQILAGWGVTLAVVPAADDAFHARLTGAGWTELFADADGWLLRAP